MTTVFVTLCDSSYFPRARRTIQELKTAGKWNGDIVLLAIDFEPEPIEGVSIVPLSHVNTDNLVSQLRANPLPPMDDNRHFAKLYQWDKLQVFKPFFRKWERVVFLDAGIRVFDTVQPLLDLDWRGKFLAPDDSDPYDNGVRFHNQLGLKSNAQAVQKLFSVYSESILNEHYFLNCIFLFDTSLLERVSFEEMIHAMNEYPICMCNEMGIMNLFFTFKLRAWVPLQQRVGDKYLFGWSERNYKENPTWKSFHFLKYSFTG
jgi:hypothetical protein